MTPDGLRRVELAKRERQGRRQRPSALTRATGLIQDPVEYNTFTHHTNMDVYDRIQAEDMMKNAVIIAAFVYHAANRDALLPRKTLPRPPQPRASQSPAITSP